MRWVEETGSTNADAAALARSGAPDGVVLVADHQTAGRGRLDRTWTAPPASSLLVSVLLRPAGLTADHAHLAATAMACAAVDAVEQLAGVRPAVKWPNDLLLAEAGAGEPRKLGGILAESVIEGSSAVAVVVGIGLNVNWPAELPPELARIAVALNHVVGHDVDREDLLVALLRAFAERAAALTDEDACRLLLERYRECCATLGATVRVEAADGTFTGVAVEVTDAGHLVVDTADGLREVVAADVVHLRPA